MHTTLFDGARHNKAGVGFVPVLADVETFDFFFLRNANANRCFEHSPSQSSHHAYINGGSEDTDSLPDQLIGATAIEQALPGVGWRQAARRDARRFGKQTHTQRSKHTVHQVHRCGADRIVDLRSIECQYGENDQHASNRANQNRDRHSHERTWSGNRDQTGKASVERHAEVWLAQAASRRSTLR